MASKYLDERVYEPGDTIFTEGETGTEMFVVQDGQVAITKTVEGREMLLTKLKRGDFFGEMALLDSRPRNATCRAIVRTHVVAIKSGELLIKLRRDPTFALEMLQTMSRRIRHLDDQLVELIRREQPSQAQLDTLIARSEYGAEGEK